MKKRKDLAKAVLELLAKKLRQQTEEVRTLWEIFNKEDLKFFELQECQLGHVSGSNKEIDLNFVHENCLLMQFCPVEDLNFIFSADL